MMTSKQYYNLVYDKFLDSDKIMNNVFIRNLHHTVTFCALHFASVKGYLPFSDDNLVHYPTVKDSIYISKLYNYSSAYKNVVHENILWDEHYTDASNLVDEYIEKYHDKVSIPEHLLREEQDCIIPNDRIVSIAKEIFI